MPNRPVLWAALVVVLGSCGPGSRPGGFDAAEPSARLEATVRAARQGDAGAVRSLVELLDSDDPAVRLAAIEALERLTSDTRGYRHYDDPGRRNAAIEEWVQSLEPGRAGPTPPSPERGPDTDG